MSEIKLSNCPLCDGEGEVIRWENPIAIDEGIAGDLFRCKSCGCCIAMGEGVPRNEGITAWNTRPREDSLAAECVNEKLKQAMQDILVFHDDAVNAFDDWQRDRIGTDGFAIAMNKAKELLKGVR